MSLLQDSTAELCDICFKDGYAQGKQDVIDIVVEMHKRGIIKDHILYRFIDNLSALKGVE